MKPILWHLPISHYSEKVRWALAYKGIEHDRRAPVPGYHMLVALTLTRGRHYTLPVLRLDGRTIGNSAPILAALEERYPDSPLYPASPGDRERALELQRFADEQLGPHVRRFAFNAIRDEPQFTDLVAQASPPALARFRESSASYARAFIGARFLAASDSAAARSRERLISALTRVERELGSDEYLVGGSFSVADLAVASLLYPVVLPREGPVAPTTAPKLAELPDQLGEPRVFEWVREMFRRHRKRG